MPTSPYPWDYAPAAGASPAPEAIMDAMNTYCRWVADNQFPAPGDVMVKRAMEESVALIRRALDAR